MFQRGELRIQNQAPGEVEKATKVLTWIRFSKRPLAPLELQHAVAVEFAESKFDEKITDLDDFVRFITGRKFSLHLRITTSLAHEHIDMLMSQEDIYGMTPISYTENYADRECYKRLPVFDTKKVCYGEKLKKKKILVSLYPVLSSSFCIAVIHQSHSFSPKTSSWHC